MNCFLVNLIFFYLFFSSIICFAEVSLREKIGQMLIFGFDGKIVSRKSPIIHAINKNNIGGVILLDYDNITKSFNKNIESRCQVKKLINDLQYFTVQSNLKHNRPQLPLIVSIDEEGGEVTRLSERFGFPKIMSAFAVRKQGVDTAVKTAKTLAETLSDAGVNLNFAPDVDLNLNPNNPIIGKKQRSFSSDPMVVSKFAKIYSHQFLKHNIQCAFKHFPGHGSSSQDSHLGFVDVSKSWQAKELIPYRQLINTDDACAVIMSAHVVNTQIDKSGLPATLSHKILTDLLRKKLNFQGVIITDDFQMKAISDHYTLDDALVLAVNAGADMFIFGNNLLTVKTTPQEVVRIIEGKVRAGKISEKRINEAYTRILKLKNKLGRV